MTLFDLFLATIVGRALLEAFAYSFLSKIFHKSKRMLDASLSIVISHIARNMVIEKK